MTDKKILILFSGCCWALTSVEAMECIFHIKNRDKGPILLSPQDLVNNLKEPKVSEIDSEGCYGVAIREAFLWIMENGCVTEDDCPYKGQRQARNPNRQVLLHLMTSIAFVHLKVTKNSLICLLNQYHPMNLPISLLSCIPHSILDSLIRK